MRFPRLILLLAAVLVGALGACGGDDQASDTPTNWALPKDASAAASQAGLQMLGREMLEVHYHAHVDVIVRNKKITVPANIGIDTKKGAITALHTHDTTGIIHIESGEDIPFTLGQLFTEWGQPLSARSIGPVIMTGNEELRVYENGQRITGDPAQLRLKQHAEIVVWVGDKSDANPKVPSSYSFPQGV